MWLKQLFQRHPRIDCAVDGFRFTGSLLPANHRAAWGGLLMAFKLRLPWSGRRSASSSGRFTFKQVALGVLVAVFVMMTVLSAFTPVPALGAGRPGLPAVIPLTFFLTMFALLVWGFAASLRPPSYAALVMLLPWSAGVALLCRGLWESLCQPAKGLPDYCNVEWGGMRFKGLSPLAWAIVLLCLMPFLVSFCMATLVAVRHRYRRDAYIVSSRSPAPAQWRSIQMEWEYERGRSEAIEASVAQQALIFGALVSLTLVVCVLIIAPWFVTAGAAGKARASVVTAIAIAAASAGSFLLTAGRILVRVASHEAGSRTFAWATKLHFVAVLSAALLGLLLSYGFLTRDEKSHVSAALVGGLVIGFLGGRATQVVVERAAASVSGLKIQPTARKESDLIKIDGIDQEHIDHFVEEGIASIHQLARAPTPRLFFLTQYSLRMICEWQSQALLFDMLQNSTETFRIAHGVRGVVDARRHLLLKGEAGHRRIHLLPLLSGAQDATSEKLALEDELAVQLIKDAPEVVRLEQYQEAILIVPEQDGVPVKAEERRAGGADRRKGLDRRAGPKRRFGAERRKGSGRRHTPDRRLWMPVGGSAPSGSTGRGG
jgi:hypothetical protein